MPYPTTIHNLEPPLKKTKGSGDSLLTASEVEVVTMGEAVTGKMRMWRGRCGQGRGGKGRGSSHREGTTKSCEAPARPQRLLEKRWSLKKPTSEELAEGTPRKEALPPEKKQRIPSPVRTHEVWRRLVGGGRRDGGERRNRSEGVTGEVSPSGNE